MKKILLCFFLIPSLYGATAKKTICLNMIVKDEKDVIERCLESVKPLIDYWVIFDTGSTDGTQEVIKNCMKGIPGELHERPWVNFAHNRNEALNGARDHGDYLLIIDADEVLTYDTEFSLPDLDEDFYNSTVRQVGAGDCARIALISTQLNWTWVGVLHEVLVCPEARTAGFLSGVVNLCNTATGARSKLSDKEKYLKDAKVLETALKEEPNNSRYMFYLGMSYSAAGQFGLAEKVYAKRIAMESSDVQETYQAMYNMAIAQEQQGRFDEAIETHFKAHAWRPSRAEPLFHIAKLYRQQDKLLLGYLMSKYALTFPYPQSDVCVEYMVYNHERLIEFANCALLLGKFDEGFTACTKLLQNPHLPEEMKAPVTANYELARNKVHKK